MGTAESDCYDGPIVATLRYIGILHPDYKKYEALNRAVNTMNWFSSGRRPVTDYCQYGGFCTEENAWRC